MASRRRGPGRRRGRTTRGLARPRNHRPQRRDPDQRLGDTSDSWRRPAGAGSARVAAVDPTSSTATTTTGSRSDRRPRCRWVARRSSGQRRRRRPGRGTTEAKTENSGSSTSSVAPTAPPTRPAIPSGRCAPHPGQLFLGRAEPTAAEGDPGQGGGVVALAASGEPGREQGRVGHDRRPGPAPGPSRPEPKPARTRSTTCVGRAHDANVPEARWGPAPGPGRYVAGVHERAPATPRRRRAHDLETAGRPLHRGRRRLPRRPGSRLFSAAAGRGRPTSRPAASLVWSDIPNDRMLRWDETTGKTGVFRQPAGSQRQHPRSQGRLVTCEHGTRRVPPDRARRLDHGGRRPLRGQAIQQPERRRRRRRRIDLVHRPGVRHRQRLRGHRATSETAGATCTAVDLDRRAPCRATTSSAERAGVLPRRDAASTSSTRAGATSGCSTSPTTGGWRRPGPRRQHRGHVRRRPSRHRRPDLGGGRGRRPLPAPRRHPARQAAAARDRRQPHLRRAEAQPAFACASTSVYLIMLNVTGAPARTRRPSTRTR